jgi:hypothetical protein
MDTMGLATLGLPDVQCHGSAYHPPFVAEALYNTASYLFETGAIPAEGPAVESPRYPGLWCSAASSMMAPFRAAVTIRPSDQLAVQWVQVPGRFCISYFRVENGISYHGTISDIDGVPKATWSFEEAGQRVTRDQSIDQETFAFLLMGTRDMKVFQRSMILTSEGQMKPASHHCIVLESEGRANGFMVPAGETDPDFARWLKALNVPKPTAAMENEEKRPWWKLW